MKKIKFILILILSIFAVAGCSTTNNSDKVLSSEQWKEDIDYLDEKMKSYHPELFKHISKEEWNHNIDTLKSEIDNLSDVETSLRISQLIASIQDGHTTTDILNLITPIGQDTTNFDDVLVFPLVFEFFDDGLRVVVCDESYEELLGYKLISINGIETNEILARLSTMMSGEYNNKQYPIQKSKDNISVYEILKFFEIVESESAEYVFEDFNNKKITMNLEAIKNKDIIYVDKYISTSKISKKPQNQSDIYWYQYFQEDHVLYLRINSFYSSTQTNLSTEEKEGLPNIIDFKNELVNEIEYSSPNKIVVDLRNNNGGYMEYVNMFLSIFKDEVNIEDTEIVVLTGKNTFSAGVLFAYKLQQDIGATIVGEESGGNVNTLSSKGDYIALPNSNLFIFYSYYSEYEEIKDYTGGVKPDVEVIQSYGSFINGIDDLYSYIEK